LKKVYFQAHGQLTKQPHHALGVTEKVNYAKNGVNREVFSLYNRPHIWPIAVTCWYSFEAPTAATFESDVSPDPECHPITFHLLSTPEMTNAVI
jgi:hypothetical protein